MTRKRAASPGAKAPKRRAAAGEPAPAKPRASRARGAGELFLARPKERVPFGFVLDELADLDPWTRPMFGCLAVYVGERIVLVLRDRPTYPEDNGVWIATTVEHHASLSKELPGLRSIRALGDGVTGWQSLSAGAPDFEEAVMHACALVRRGDPRIGKVPARRRPRAPH